MNWTVINLCSFGQHLWPLWWAPLASVSQSVPSSSLGWGLYCDQYAIHTSKNDDLTHSHDMGIGLSGAFVILVKLLHSCLEGWNEQCVTQLVWCLLPCCMQLLQCGESILEARSWWWWKRLLSVICILNKARHQSHSSLEPCTYLENVAE